MLNSIDKVSSHRSPLKKMLNNKSSKSCGAEPGQSKQFLTQSRHRYEEGTRREVDEYLNKDELKIKCYNDKVEERVWVEVHRYCNTYIGDVRSPRPKLDGNNSP